ncbi:hypothetical protein BS78_09G050100 [Paspalum vaginatum]|nr:hypothetical protein BS78_09G050100 [Paspalum vaginatum]
MQCDIGHAATGKCYSCRVATSYRRCHAMERLVDSIHVPCAYAAHGCPVRPAYHNRESHRLACVHAPCHCPGEACSFVGSTEALLNHFSAVHSWPCIVTNASANNYGDLTVWLRDGFNFVLADGNEQGTTTVSAKSLLLLTVVRQAHARIISVHCIDPHAAAASQGPNSNKMQCRLWYSSYSSCNQCINHYQTSTFRIVCTDLSNGVPKPDDCFQSVVPNSVIGHHDKDDIKVNFRITLIK